MKKFPLLFLVFALAAGFAAAEEAEGIGLTAGVEFGVVEVNTDDRGYYLDVFVEYENSFLDEALDVSASLLYDLSFSDPDNEHSLTLDFSIGFNLGLGASSTLSFILANENDFTLFPKEGHPVLGIIRPGIGFNQGLGDSGGDLYAQVDAPIRYLNYGDEPVYYGLDFTLGWASSFGLGLEAGAYLLLSPSHKIILNNKAVNGLTGISFTVSYENGPFYADIAATAPIKKASYNKGYLYVDEGSAPYSYFDTSAGSGGVSITPSFAYTFDFGLGIYVYCTFDGIGIKDNGISISPAIGVTYSF